MNVIFVCSGTAGHINPALAIAEKLREKQAKILFVGAGREMENRLVPQAGYEIVNIKMSGLLRKPSLKMITHNIKTVKNLLSAKKMVLKIFKEFEPDIVIGTGGYVCYPVIKAAHKNKIPTLIHESNVSPGLSVKLLSAVADKVMTSFPGREFCYKRPERVVYTGTPVLSRKSAIGENKPEKNEDADKAVMPLIVSFWGSLGAENMNKMMPEFIRLLIKDGGLRLIHAAGNSQDAELIKKEVGRHTDIDNYCRLVEIREYIDNMPELLSDADVIMCRSGGATIGEIIANTIPAVLIPSPYVSNNEQMENAKQLEKIGGAVVLEEKNCTGAFLFEQVTKIINDEKKRKEMSEALFSISRPDAAEYIADYIMSLAGK